VRAAFSKNMTLLDLAQWGGGLDLNYAIDTTFNPPIFRVSGATPTATRRSIRRSTNYELSFEYYLNRTSLVSLGLFRMDIKSFVKTDTVKRTDLPDLDGVVRSTVFINSQVQGKGGYLQGLEAGAKLGFDFRRVRWVVSGWT
jgi:outer membrane receptor protein involved in Fe transport